MGEGVTLLRKGALGDVILLGAVTGAIDGRVTVVTDARFVGIASRLIGVDRVLPWSADLPAGRVVDLQGGLRGLRRAPFAERIRKHSVRRRLRLWAPWIARRPTVPELYAATLGVKPRPLPWIAGAPGGPGLALLPGASVALKRWSSERFAAVGRSWDGPVTVFGSPDEAELVAAVAQQVPGCSVVVEWGFDRTIDAMGRCGVAVSNDSGLMHLAGALGLKVVALFGPTHPDDGFFAYRGEVVQTADRCRPCTLHRRVDCHVGDRRCLDVPADHVFAAVQRCVG